MSLHEDLLEHAFQLARLDPRRPKQVNLRRSVSASYYALFHLLTTEASRLYAGDYELLARINRTYNHAELKKVSTFFAQSRLPRALQPPTGGYAAPAELKNVANRFVLLQQARHEAEYDLVRAFSRDEAVNHAQRARDAFADWEIVKKTDDARLYLACFLLWKRWDEEPR
jgi:hypothetical protein